MNTSERPFKGMFIVVDGPDYSGKGVQSRKIGTYLLRHPADNGNKFISIVQTHEPQNSVYSQRIRELLREGKDIASIQNTLADLFIADRELHVDSIIAPNVSAGMAVIVDRHKYSTVAYQSVTGVPFEELVARQSQFPTPDLVFFVLPSVEECMRRKATAKGRAYDELFEKNKDFQTQVHARYKEIAATVYADEPIVLIESDGTTEEVFALIKPHIDKLVEERL